MLRAYFDESERPDGTFCVAGFVFPRGQVRRFEEDWRAMLPDGRIFHMRDVVHWTRDFRDLAGRDEAKALLDEAVGIVAKRARLGVVVACNLKEMRPILPAVRGFSRAYPLCAHVCLAAIGRWLDQQNRRDVVSYFFEQGNPAPQGDADALMHLVRRDATLRHAYHYHSHRFAGKGEALPLQAADLLAWEYGRFKGEHFDSPSHKEPLRDEFVTLIMAQRIEYVSLHLRPDSAQVRMYLARVEAFAREIEADLATTDC